MGESTAVTDSGPETGSPSDGNGRARVPLVVSLDDPRATDALVTGGKGASLARLRRGGVAVADGFCVTTAAFGAVAGRKAREAIGRLTRADPEDGSLARRAADVRDRILERSVPPSVHEAVAAALHASGDDRAYAVRSSATAEDLAQASFAGQHETVLNVRGEEALVEAVRACMASLFTEGAVVYRTRHGISHGSVAMAVVVQHMVEAEASGVAFSADPATGNRHVAVIEGVFGLGEAEVGGLVTPDRARVDRRSGWILDYAVGTKRVAVAAAEGGGTQTAEVGEAERRARVLSDEDVRAVAGIVAAAERLFGVPQDVEWALDAGRLVVLQARPITALFPLPSPPPADEALHVYYSFGHKQAMPEAMPPLALDVWRHVALARIATAEAGGRLYVDLTPILTRPLLRRWLLRALEWSDKPTKGDLEALLEHHDLAGGPRATLRDLDAFGLRPRNVVVIVHALLLRPTSGVAARELAWYRRYADDAITRVRSHPEALGRARAVLAELVAAAEDLVARFYPFLSATMAEAWLKRLCGGCGPEVDAVGKGLDADVITAMNLALGDLADVARDHPLVAQAIARGADTGDIASVEGGGQFLDALARFLEGYGFRGPAEIDVSRPRWREDPKPLLQAIRGNLAGGERGEQRLRVAHLADGARGAADRLRARAGEGPMGRARQRVVTRLVEVVRAYLPVREMPKFALAAMLSEARAQFLDAGVSLVRAGRLDAVEDVWYLRLEELLTALNDPTTPLGVDIAERRSAVEGQAAMRAPRVLTSDGEVAGRAASAAGLPDGALTGMPVSSGVAEGRARVVVDPSVAVLEKGEILVGRYCDPGWTPLFLNAAGMVMEVGGLMTHGSLVAREYGIPAVVSVDEATTRIHCGQRIRVDGNRGTVEILA